jgi:hypothetical protein
METRSIPATCATALKEWATVLEAMARGEQTVLIRKGGLIEPGSGFELLTNTFVFYPTFEHQAVQYLRDPCQGYFEEAVKRRAADGQIHVELFGTVVCSATSNDSTIVERLSAFHIYNNAFVAQRLKWQPDQPLVIVVVRAFRLAVPQRLPVQPHYAGCRSWVSLDAPVSLEGASPVLDEVSFQQQVQALRSLLFL